MATRECSICLDELKDPVAIPCGHIHCEQCLFQYIEECPSPTEAPCPTCRTLFPIVQPDLRLIPQKFRPFIMTSMRRVYLPKPEETNQQALLDQVRTLEKRVKSLKKDKLSLMERCESLSSECDVLIGRESELQDDYDTLAAKMNEAESEILELEDALSASNREADKWKTSFSQLSRKYKDSKSKSEAAKNEIKRKLEVANNELQEHKEQQRRNQEKRQPTSSRSHKRNSEQAALDSSTASSSSPPANSIRAIHPIPKRPRLDRLTPALQVSESTPRAGVTSRSSAIPRPPNFKSALSRQNDRTRFQRRIVDSDSDEDDLSFAHNFGTVRFLGGRGCIVSDHSD
ncbi:hypothetical protein QCA50_010443 [Cerrena zonata]|uniref:RING-type domain-containing protein n=1 Tax=Cerrena zonata TaxID=2478898 RepID=A0AAW0G8C5_9APHY